ncbi:hypothetical protein [Streptomyces sp. NPDC006446]|uniref:hypothetical protein n=1 Tax=Streptomyces sp. NPDC006446 TaxID=3154301 RepID=UPI0033AE03D7
MAVFDGDGPDVVPGVPVGEVDEPVGVAVPVDAVPGVGPAHAGADTVSPDKVIAAVTAVMVTRLCLSLISPSIWSFRIVVSDPDLVQATDRSQRRPDMPNLCATSIHGARSGNPGSGKGI